MLDALKSYNESLLLELKDRFVYVKRKDGNSIKEKPHFKDLLFLNVYEERKENVAEVGNINLNNTLFLKEGLVPINIVDDSASIVDPQLTRIKVKDIDFIID